MSLMRACAWTMNLKMAKVLTNVANIRRELAIPGPMTKQTTLKAWLVRMGFARPALPLQLGSEECLHGLIRHVVDRNEMFSDEDSSALLAAEVLRFELLLNMSTSKAFAWAKAALGSLVAAHRLSSSPVDFTAEDAVARSSGLNLVELGLRPDIVLVLLFVLLLVGVAARLGVDCQTVPIGEDLSIHHASLWITVTGDPIKHWEVVCTFLASCRKAKTGTKRARHKGAYSMVGMLTWGSAA